MVRYTVILASIVTIGLGQPADSSATEKPWDTPVFVKGQTQGIHSLAMKEYPVYLKLVYQTVRNREGRNYLAQRDAEKTDNEFNRSHRFHGWTVSCAMVTGLIVTMFYIEKLF